MSQFGSGGSSQNSGGSDEARPAPPKKLIERRIGRALSQFFKPIRMAPPHTEGQKPVDPDTLTKPHVKLIRLKTNSKDDQAAIPENFVPLAKRIDLEEIPAPEKPITNWLDLVVYLLLVCRRASQILRGRKAIDTYQKVFFAKGQKKLKAAGSIIDAREKID